jgi:hypothetical protein
MRKIYDFLFSVFDSFGKARAASVLTRMGRHEEARKLMLDR